MRLATAKKLFQKRAWQRLLYLLPAWFGRSSPLVDDPHFFLSKHRGDLKAEIIATLHAFFVPESHFKDTNMHPQCRYPARFKWLDGELHFDLTRMPHPKCEKLALWREYMKAEAVSYVFSSSYVNNPASMFGHGFLRFTKKRDEASSSALLDPAVGFAAQNVVSNPFVYVIAGLTGGFQGVFGVTPYYLKVQEYNNSESRDLWEYELNFSPNEIETMALSLWELGPHHISYYYLDRNCAYVLLALLEVGRSDLDLTSQFHGWVIPAETLKALTKIPNMIRSMRYRPSILHRFSARQGLLNAQETKQLEDLFATQHEPIPKVAKLAALGNDEAARVTDAALDYIDYKEGLAGSQTSVRYASLQHALLNQRSRIDSPTASISGIPFRDRPDTGQGALRLGAGGGLSIDQGAYTRLKLRPALHDLADASQGYSKDLAISFFDTQLDIYPSIRRINLSRFELVEITSLAPWKPMLQPFSWRLALGSESIRRCLPGDYLCHRIRIEGGAGLSGRWFHDHALGFVLLLADMGYGISGMVRPEAGPGLASGSVIDLTDRMKIMGLFHAVKWFGGSLPYEISTTLAFAWNFNSSMQLRIHAGYENGDREFGALIHFYE